MGYFRDIPIRRKLMVITMMTTGVALLLAAIGIVAFDAYFFRRSLKRDLTALSRMIADNSTAAIVFNDPRSATETLNALRARPHLLAACIYRADGTTLAGYSRENAAAGCPTAPQDDDFRFSGNLTVVNPIELKGERIGTLAMVYDLEEIPERMLLYGGTVLGVLLIASLVAFQLSSRMRAAIATPISDLVRAATSVSQTNDYSVRAQKQSNDELGVLVEGFNEMLAGIQRRDRDLRAALRDREAALREAEAARERFRFMAESMPQKIFTAKPTGEVDYFNQQWMDYTGLTFEQLRDFGWRRSIHPDDLDSNLESWRHSIETGEPVSSELRWRRADGVYRWHLSRACAMRDSSGEITMWIGSSTDIHEQKEKEQELRRANEDLQQFAYSASHDLQEPIRNVSVYSEIVAKRYRHLMDAEGLQFLGFLTEGGRRLATLIDDLLAYTRAGVGEGGEPAVDAASALQETLSSLAEAIRQSQASVTHDALPEICMSAAHLQQVFQNLINNALKYRGENPPEIHVSAVKQGSTWRFSVRDNGIGIDPEYKEKIFGVFKRLHRDQRYSGTGIGLAICQRVVERYGGRIWVESAVGEGATFYFTVPPVPKAAAAVESATG